MAKKTKQPYFKGPDGRFVNSSEYYYLLREKKVVKSRTTNYRGSIKNLRMILAKKISVQTGGKIQRGAKSRKELYKAARQTAETKKLRKGETRQQAYIKSKEKLKQAVLDTGKGDKWTYFRWGFYVSYRIDGQSPPMPKEGRNAAVLPNIASLNTMKDRADWQYNYQELISWCMRAKAKADAENKNIIFWVLPSSGYEYHNYIDAGGFNRIIRGSEIIYTDRDLYNDIIRAAGV